MILKEKMVMRLIGKKLYKELSIDSSNYVMIFPGEINNNKNQKLLLDATKIRLNP